jgi:hypothetical protein
MPKLKKLREYSFQFLNLFKLDAPTQETFQKKNLHLPLGNKITQTQT